MNGQLYASTVLPVGQRLFYPQIRKAGQTPRCAEEANCLPLSQFEPRLLGVQTLYKITVPTELSWFLEPENSRELSALEICL